MPKSFATKHKNISGLREIVFGAVIGAFAFASVTALSISANAGEADIAVPAGKMN